MDIMSLIRAEVVSYRDVIRKEISGMDEHKLTNWCRERIQERTSICEKLTANGHSPLDPVRIIKSCGHGDVSREEDVQAVLELAKEYPVWRDALLKVARELRHKKEPIPDVWHDYVLDLALGVETGPDGRGKSNKHTRDEAIRWCIWAMAENTDFRPTRAAESEKPCGASIVANAFVDDWPNYESVKRIWSKRDKDKFPLPDDCEGT